MPRRQRANTDRALEFSSGPARRGLIGRPTLFVFWLFIVAACTALLIPAVPQYRLLKNIQSELADAEHQEQILREESHRKETEARALEKNPRYLQARARDPLRYQLKGETVIQLED